MEEDKGQEIKTDHKIYMVRIYLLEHLGSPTKLSTIHSFRRIQILGKKEEIFVLVSVSLFSTEKRNHNGNQM